MVGLTAIAVTVSLRDFPVVSNPHVTETSLSFNLQIYCQVESFEVSTAPQASYLFKDNDAD